MRDMTNKYESEVKSAIMENSSFKSICDYNKKNFPVNGYELYYRLLGRGTAILKSHEECNAYLVCYGDKHYLKMYKSYSTLRSEITSTASNFEVFDWGGGQALASGVFLDFLDDVNLKNKITAITLIDPSVPNIERGKIHLELLIDMKGYDTQLKFIAKKCEAVKPSEIRSDSCSTKIHLFSNILDMNINSKYVSELIQANCKGPAYHICVSPYGFGNLVQYSNYFLSKKIISQNTESFVGEVFRASSRKIVKDKIFRNELIFKTTYQNH